jgi:hypothetical protein
MCQTIMLPKSKGKRVVAHVMKAYGELEEWLHSFRNFVWLYELAFLNLGTDPPAPIENLSGCITKPGKDVFLLQAIAPRLLNNPANDLITKCKLQFLKPTACFNTSLSTDYS